MPNDILNYYIYNNEGTCPEIQKCLLSPRGIFIPTKNNSGKFVVCQICQYHIQRKNVIPPFAIANSFEIGIQPQILKDLTDFEISFISDVRHHLNVFSFQGGHKGIEGWHSLIKTNLKHKVKILNTLNQNNTIPNKIFIVLYGEMTENKKKTN